MATLNISATMLADAARETVGRADIFSAFKVIQPLSPVTRGQTVIVPFSSGSAAQTFTAGTGYSTNTTDTNGVSVSVNRHNWVSVFRDDAAFASLNDRAKVEELANAMDKLMYSVASASLAQVVTAGNFPLSSSYTATQYTSALAPAELRGIGISWQGQKSLIGDSTLISALYANAQYVDASVIGSNAAAMNGDTRGQNIYGFKVLDCGLTLPNSDHGIFMGKNAIALVVGLTQPPPNQNTTNYQVINVGDNMQFGYREFYNDTTAEWVRVLECLTGVAVLDNSCLRHIK